MENLFRFAGVPELVFRHQLRENFEGPRAVRRAPVPYEEHHPLRPGAIPRRRLSRPLRRRFLRAADRRAPRGRHELRQVSRRLVGQHRVRLRAPGSEGRPHLAHRRRRQWAASSSRRSRRRAATSATSSVDPARLTGAVVLGIKDKDTFPLIFLRENCADMAITEDDVEERYIAQRPRAAHHRHALLDRVHRPHQQSRARPRARATTCARCSTSTTGRCCGDSRSAATARRGSSRPTTVTRASAADPAQDRPRDRHDRGVQHRRRQHRHHGVAARGARADRRPRSSSSAARMGCAVIDGADPRVARRRVQRPWRRGRGAERAGRGRRVLRRASCPGGCAARTTTRARATRTPAARWSSRATAARRRCPRASSSTISSRNARRHSAAGPGCDADATASRDGAAHAARRGVRVRVRSSQPVLRPGAGGRRAGVAAARAQEAARRSGGADRSGAGARRPASACCATTATARTRSTPRRAAAGGSVGPWNCRAPTRWSSIAAVRSARR